MPNKKRKGKRKRKKSVVDEKPQNIVYTCQGLTQKGSQCKRQAVFTLDIKKDRKLNVFGYGLVKLPFSKLPLPPCCFYCTQHFTILALQLLGRGLQSINENFLMTKEEKAFLQDAVKSERILQQLNK